MTAISIQAPFPTIPDIDGQPLEDGYIWIGVANLAPITNPITVYWDAALTLPAVQPVRTLGGYPMNSGTPGRLYAATDYSILVQNKTGSTVYSSANNNGPLFGGTISSVDVTFLQAGTGAVERTAQSKMRDVVSVFDFMTAAQQQDVASGTGALDVTAALTAAVNYIKAVPFSEKELVFPAGAYRVTQFDFTGVRRCTFRAAGTVQINGYGTADFVFGANGYNPVNPDVNSTFSSENRFIGGYWLISNAGGTYTHIFKFNAGSSCRFENFSISGTAGAAAGANRIAAAINFCWVNRFINFNVGSPGAPGPGFRSFNIAVGPLSGSNVNNNVFESCRLQAGAVGAPYTNTVGIYFEGGNANRISTSDISALAVGIELNNERGLVAEANYHELCTQSVVRLATGNSRGNTFIGGIYEIVSNAAAFSLDSSQTTSIIGGWYFGVGGGVNRTFIAQGAACYGLSVTNPELINIDNNLTGTYYGADTVSGSRILQAQWLSFPPTQIPSSNVNTLDDYKEGTFDAEITFGNASVGVTYAYRQCSYTKIGNRVFVTGAIALSNKGSSVGVARIAGLPYTVANSTNAYSALALQFQNITFADQYSGYANIGATTIDLYETTNAGVTTSLTDVDFANNSSVVFSLQYRVA